MTDQVPLYLIAVENPEGILSMVTEQSVDGVEIVRGNGSGGVLLKLADGILAELRGVRYMDQITAEIRKREKGESALSAIFVDPTGIAPRARESILGTGVQSQDLIINPPEGVEVSALYLGDEELKARYIRENRVPEESWVTPQDIITVLVDQLKQNGSE